MKKNKRLVLNMIKITFVMLITFFVSNTFARSASINEIHPNSSNELTEDKSNWAKYFDKYKAKGTIVIVDERNGLSKRLTFNQSRAETRYSPASTFKIPHSLFALDAGLVKDEFQIFTWDGVKRSYAPHNKDQNLRSAMRHSAVWVYDLFSKKLGERKALSYLSKINYGNADPSSRKGSYWIDGSLAISAEEQINFLKKLYKNQLPFSVEHQLLVKDIMINSAESEWILRAKTGWQGSYGWWVGWVEWPSGPVYFSLNIDTPNRMKDLYKRKAIGKDILFSIGVLPNGK
jgi:beta-lactamase class D